MQQGRHGKHPPQLRCPCRSRFHFSAQGSTYLACDQPAVYMFFGCASSNEDFGREPGLPSQPQQPLHNPCLQQARHRARDLLRVRSWVPLSSYGNFLRFSPIITSSTSTKPCRLRLVRSGLFCGFYRWIFSEKVKAGVQAQPDGRHGRGPRGTTCVSRYRCRSRHPGLGLKKIIKKKDS